jgi:hypothetical protein
MPKVSGEFDFGVYRSVITPNLHEAQIQLYILTFLRNGPSFVTWNIDLIKSYKFYLKLLSRLFNEKFWGELIAYFPLMQHGLHRKRRLQ